METINGAALAALFELTQRRVQQLASDGIIPRAERGQYDFERSVRGYVRFLRDASERSKRGSDQMADAKLRHETARAEVSELELAEKRGESLPANETEMAWARVASNIRANILAVPVKLAQELAAASTEQECYALLETALHEALEALAETKIHPPPRD